MAAYKTTSPLLSLPSAANGVTVTPPGVSEGWSSWVEMAASAASAMRVATIVAFPGTRVNGNYYEVEIGTGASGHETPVAAARGISGFNAGAAADYSDVLTLGIPADVITLGQRVSCRLRQTSTSTTAWHVAFQYWALPMTGTVPASTVGPVNVPSGTVFAPVTGAAGAYGAWTEVTPSADGDWTITNVTCIGPNGGSWEVEFGIGGSGSEVPTWSVRSYAVWFFNANAWQGGPWNILLRPTLGPIPAGSRIAMRVRSGSGVFALGIGLTVVKQAVAGAASNLRMLWADWTTVTSAAGGLSSFTAWNTLIASTATDILVSGMAKTYPQAGLSGRNVIQLGVGDAGQEVLFAEFFVLNGIWGGGRFNFPLPYARAIPQGSRVSLRFATEHAGGGINTTFTMSYQEVLTVPDFDNWSPDLIQQAYQNLVDASRAFSPVCGSPAWANGTWVTVDASVPVDRVLTAYMTSNPALIEYELDFGIGAPGDEVPLTTLRMSSGSNDSDGSVMHDVLPIPAIMAAGSRLSVRARSSTAGATIGVVPHYTAEPVTTPAPVILSLDYDCGTEIFTITGTGFDQVDAALETVTQDGVSIAFTVLTQTANVITFQIGVPFANGTYCAIVSSEDGSSPLFCADVECDCLALTDDPDPTPEPEVCLPIED